MLNSMKSEGELRRFLEESTVLTDSLSVELIKRVGGPRSPMAVTDLPIPNFPRDGALARLYQLERLGILKSDLEKRNEDYIRVFRGTPIATRIAQIMGSK